MSFRLVGDSFYVQNGKKLPAAKDDIVFVPANVDYGRIVPDYEDLIIFHFSVFQYVSEELCIFKVKNPEYYRERCQKALAVWSEKAVGYKAAATAIFYEIIAELMREGHGGEECRERFVTEAAEKMRRSFSDASLTVSRLAEEAFVSDAYFRRRFRAFYGVPPKHYLLSLRMEYAISLLETGYYSHTEIAERCGFSDVKYFRTAFRCYTGVPLSKYGYKFP